MVDLVALLALAKPITLHSITGEDECFSGRLLTLHGDFFPWGGRRRRRGEGAF